MEHSNLPLEKLNKGKKLNICILGGGNIGTLLIADLSRDTRLSVRLLTTKPDKWSNSIDVYDNNENLEFTGKVDLISNNPADVIEDADIVISTLPSHVFPDVLRKIEAFIKVGAWIGVMPGSGGCEFYLKNLLNRGCVIFGFQRVHGISRIKTYGQSVYNLGKKSELFIASIPSSLASNVANLMESLLNIKCIPIKNYLAVTLTPSNPILHTSRLYSLFHACDDNFIWEREPYFYYDWTDKDSEILIECDNELQRFCNIIKEIDLSPVRSLKIHYESNTAKEMTNKIRSIKAFKGIKAPMVPHKWGFIPDYNSRYFVEDFPYGLCIIKSFSSIADINTPMIDEILKWYESKYNIEYFFNNQFKGKDLAGLPLPQNFNIRTVDDIVQFYKDTID